MYRLRTPGDWIFYFLICTAMTALGVWLLLFPIEPLPAQPQAYTQKTGLLDSVVARSTRRKGAWAQFRLVDDPIVYESRARLINEISSNWQPHRASLSFYALRQSGHTGTPSDPELVYGLVADGTATGALAAEIEHLNAARSRWGGGLALGFGFFGYAMAGLVWFRRRVQRKK